MFTVYSLALKPVFLHFSKCFEFLPSMPRRHNNPPPPRIYSINKEELLMISIPEKTSIQESYSPQRIYGIVRKPAKDLWDCPCLGLFSPCLGVICVVGVSPGLSFAIDRPKWNIGFLSASVLKCGRITLKNSYFAGYFSPCC